MELTMRSTVHLLSILFTGLTAGLCFTWSNAVTPGIGRLDHLAFLQSFQMMNRAIMNPVFFIVFFSPVFLLFVNSYLYRNTTPAIFYLFLVAGILFLAGIGWVTIFKNVPLNEMLDKTILETATQIELEELRKNFESSWNRWHMLRTVTSFTTFFLLLTGTLLTK